MPFLLQHAGWEAAGAFCRGHQLRSSRRRISSRHNAASLGMEIMFSPSSRYVKFFAYYREMPPCRLLLIIARFEEGHVLVKWCFNRSPRLRSLFTFRGQKERIASRNIMWTVIMPPRADITPPPWSLTSPRLAGSDRSALMAGPLPPCFIFRHDYIYILTVLPSRW